MSDNHIWSHTYNWFNLSFQAGVKSLNVFEFDSLANLRRLQTAHKNSINRFASVHRRTRNAFANVQEIAPSCVQFLDKHSWCSGCGFKSKWAHLPLSPTIFNSKDAETCASKLVRKMQAFFEWPTCGVMCDSASTKARQDHLLGFPMEAQKPTHER